MHLVGVIRLVHFLKYIAKRGAENQGKILSWVAEISEIWKGIKSIIDQRVNLLKMSIMRV